MADNKRSVRDIAADLAQQLAQRVLPTPAGPIAATRISRTPIYQTSGASWPDVKTAEFDPSTGNISVRGLDGDNARTVLPHESAHALFDRAALAPQSSDLAGQVPGEMRSVINYFPQLYQPAQSAEPAEQQRYQEMMANEGLAYAIGKDDGTPYVRAAANLIKDPNTRAQLIRLHNNALANNSTVNLMRSPVK